MVELPELSFGRSDADVRPANGTLRGQLERGEQVDVELIAKRLDGSTFWCRLRGRSVDPTRPLSGGVVWIVEDVTERRRMAQSLADARDAAEAASRAKSAFLANTSHEIRTPLNGLIGLARIALLDKTDQPTRMRYLRQMLDSAESLAEIMGSVLDMSKIEAGKLAVEALSFDLHNVLTSLHGTYATVADQRQLRCTLDIAADVPRLVHGDPLRTRQIVSNFVTNALKFTEHGEVAITARQDGANQIRIEVRDTGIGVDAPTLARLFRPFTQADDSTTRRFGGTGLGLSICRELANLLGGSVGAESSPGHGSVFWVTLPLAKSDAVQLAPSSTMLSPATSTMSRTSAKLSDAPPPLVNAGALRGARILLAEDNPINMIIATTLLSDWGCVVTEVGNGQLAVEAVDAAATAGAPIDLVLMDVQMPVLDGFGATRALRERYADDTLPIVALTAGVLAAEREEALACGMNAFHAKPFDERALQQALIDLLTRQRPPQRRASA